VKPSSDPLLDAKAAATLDAVNSGSASRDVKRKHARRAGV